MTTGVPRPSRGPDDGNTRRAANRAGDDRVGGVPARTPSPGGPAASGEAAEALEDRLRAHLSHRAAGITAAALRPAGVPSAPRRRTPSSRTVVPVLAALAACLVAVLWSLPPDAGRGGSPVTPVAPGEPAPLETTPATPAVPTRGTTHAPPGVREPWPSATVTPTGGPSPEAGGSTPSAVPTQAVGREPGGLDGPPATGSATASPSGEAWPGG